MKEVMASRGWEEQGEVTAVLTWVVIELLGVTDLPSTMDDDLHQDGFRDALQVVLRNLAD